MKRHFRSDRREAKNARLREEYSGIDSENVSYDFFKGLTSLSILSLGGILGLSESVFIDKVTTWQMLVAGGLVAASGITALQCQADIVQVSRNRKEPTIWLRWGHRVAPGLLGGGIGAFLIMLAGVFS